MSEQHDGGPAFAHGNPEQGGDPGMSLRDWFAGQALLGILSGPSSRDGVPLTEWFDAPEQAYRLADVMLTTRSKGGAA